MPEDNKITREQIRKELEAAGWVVTEDMIDGYVEGFLAALSKVRQFAVFNVGKE